MVLDNGSTDNTADILGQLSAEGLPLTIFTDASVGFWQSERMTKLMHLAAEELAPDWILPLDVDEFLATDGTPLRDLLRRRMSPVLVRWRSYVPHPSDDPGDRNPVSRIRHRLAAEGHDWSKILIPADIARTGLIHQGNHDVTADGFEESERVILDGAWICHFPIRDPSQFITKIAIHNLQYFARSADRAGFGFHIKEQFRDLLNDWQEVSRSYAEVARTYALTESDLEVFEPELVVDAMPYRGGRLRYTPGAGTSDPLTVVLEYAVQLARRVAELERKIESPLNGDSSAQSARW